MVCTRYISTASNFNIVIFKVTTLDSRKGYRLMTTITKGGHMPTFNTNKRRKRLYAEHTSYHDSFGGNSNSVRFRKCQTEYNYRSGFSANSPRNSKGLLMLRTNPYVLDRKRERSDARGVFRTTNHYGCIPDFPYFAISERSRFQDWGARTYYPSLGTSHAEYQATAAFYNEVAAAKVNLALAFAERQKTIDLVTSTATKIAKAIMYLKKGKVKKTFETLGISGKRAVRRKCAKQPYLPYCRRRKKQLNFCRKYPRHKNCSGDTNSEKIANQWLEIQYGWQPLYNDIYGAMIATVPRPVRVPIRVSRRSSESYSSTTYDSFRDCMVERLYTIKTFADVSGPAIAQTNELGLANPAILAWELVPFSFVVDWFIPIGSWLEAQSALLGISLKDTSVTHTNTYLYTVRGSYSPVENCMESYNVTQGFNSGARKTKNRVTGVVPPLHPPRWKNPLSVTHALNAIALLNNTVGSSIRR